MPVGRPAPAPASSVGDRTGRVLPGRRVLSCAATGGRGDVGIGRRIGDTVRLPGRRARRSLIVLVVVAVAGASGGAVALTGPTLVQRLGLVRAAETAQAPPEPQAVL